MRNDKISESRRLYNITGNKPKYNHNSINEILHGGSTIFFAAECREYKEHSQPDNQLIPGEHAERTKQE